MKILQLCKKFPFPVKDGEAIAVTNLSRALHQLGCSIHLLSMNTKKHYYDAPSTPQALQHYTSIQKVDMDASVKVGDAFFNLFSNKSYHISRFVSADFRDALIQLLQQETFDIVQLETLYLAPYIPYIRQYSKAVIAMRAHNVEHEIWGRITANAASTLKKWYLRLLTKRLKDYEVAQLQQYDLLIPITERDRHKFKGLGYTRKSVVVPIGLDTKAYPANPTSYQQRPSISFIGSLDWMPNQEGLRWFLDKVWNRIVEKYPDLSLHIAGRNTPDWMHHMKLPNVKVYGEVPDATNFINAHSIMVVPLLSGSGMRAKILEGMALGKVVMTTSLGLEGIAAQHKEEVLVADTISEFEDCIHFCFQSNGKLKEIGHKAQQFVATHYDHLKLARHLATTYQSLLLSTDVQSDA